MSRALAAIALLLCSHAHAKIEAGQAPAGTRSKMDAKAPGKFESDRGARVPKKPDEGRIPSTRPVAI